MPARRKETAASEVFIKDEAATLDAPIDARAARRATREQKGKNIAKSKILKEKNKDVSAKARPDHATSGKVTNKVENSVEAELAAVNNGLAANTDDKKQASVKAGHDAPGPSAKVAKKAENSIEAELAAGDQGPSSVSAAAPAETIGDELKSLLAEHLEAIDNKLAEHLNAIDNKIAPVVEELKAMKAGKIASPGSVTQKSSTSKKLPSLDTHVTAELDGFYDDDGGALPATPDAANKAPAPGRGVLEVDE
ncbi:g6186 [Coccomyxa viridis]|uniref:G6186 protein n=1 Tax=Coccomyxa viridis TaxID=1274662 RepID=A0ABP1FZU6_9CHLO